MHDEQKTVLITGAGRGLGKALALTFLEGSWRVVATDLSAPEYKEAGAGNSGLLCLAMDVTSDESVAAAFLTLKAMDITLDLIINNAGIDRYMLLSEAPVSDFRRIFEVNVFGGYRVNQVFLSMLSRPGGRIIHVGSESLNLTMPFMAYPLSKKLVEGYAKALRQELKFHGIDVVVVRPGAIRTELLNTVSGLKAFPVPEADTNPLKAAFNSFAAQAAKEIGRVISPESAASFIFGIAARPRPKAVYRINNMLQLRIAALLPYGLLERVVHKRLNKK